MKTRIALVLSAAAVALLCGCTASHPQTLRFHDYQSMCLDTKLSLDFRAHFGEGWSLPKLPGTREAFEREESEQFTRPGVQFRLFADANYRDAQDGDVVRTGEYAVVNEATFAGVDNVDGDFRIMRERGGVTFGFFVNRFILGFGLGVFYHALQIDGSVRNSIDTIRGSLHNDNNGWGYLFWLEISPGYPPLRLYATWAKWSDYGGKGYWLGEETEFGIKYRFRGFELAVGYRIDEFSGRTDHDVYAQSRLKFYLKGPVVSFGVAF